jgi:Holliday junction resolvase RusA-like endonuclease
MEITILGRIPSKKNSKIMVCRGRYPILLPSAKYQEWHKDASKQLTGAHRGKICPTMIEIKVFSPDSRKSDLTNKAESIMDLLVDNGVLEDDNWFCCPNISLKFGGTDKDNPRAEIKIN